jgi:protein SCO1/2
MHRARALAWFALVLAALGVASRAQGALQDGGADSGAFDPKAALQTSQQAIGNEIGELVLIDRAGRPLPLANRRGRPMLLSLVYTKCPEVCPMSTRYLGKAVQAMTDAFGAESFSVLTVGFDAAVDTPEAMRKFASDQGIDFPNWEFASADPATIANLTSRLGFRFRSTSMGFEHLSELAIIDRSGRVYRKVYGDAFELPQLGDALKVLLGRQAVETPSWHGLATRVRLFCTVYDPASGRYRRDYSFFAGMVISALMVIPFGYWLAREIRRAFGPAGRKTQSTT